MHSVAYELFDFPQLDHYHSLPEDASAFIKRLQQWMDAHPSPDHCYRVEYQSSVPQEHPEYSIVCLHLSRLVDIYHSLRELAEAFEDYDKNSCEFCQFQFPQSNDEPLIVKYCEVDSFMREYVISVA